MMTWGGFWKPGAKSSFQIQMLLLFKKARFVIFTLDLLIKDLGKEKAAGEHSETTPNSYYVQRLGHDLERQDLLDNAGPMPPMNPSHR